MIKLRTNENMETYGGYVFFLEGTNCILPTYVGWDQGRTIFTIK